MLAMDKTRIILDGRILEDVNSCDIKLDFINNKNEVILQIKGNPIKAELLNIDSVEENAFNKNLNTITWTQFICKKN